MSRLTIRAEADGEKAVWYGDREVFLEGEVGYEEADKLAHYEDLEEQGRLIELPCAVGDTVYVKMLGGGLAKAKVRDYVHFLTDGFCLTLTSDEFPKQHIPISEIGKTVFLTPEEAEAKLAEMEGAE